MADEVKITAQKGARVNDDDRLALASLLIKFGYTVRIGKEKHAGEKTATTFIAYKE